MTRPSPIRIRLPDGQVIFVGGETVEAQQAERDRIINAYAESAARKQVVREWRAGWEAIKQQGAAWLTDTPPQGAPSLALHAQQIAYLYDHLRDMTRWLGDVGDAFLVAVDAIDGLLDEDTVEIIME